MTPYRPHDRFGIDAWQADPLGPMNPGERRAWDERVLGIPGGGL